MKVYKINAFTILEVLINMVIMSIIIGLVYFIYSSFSKQIIFYQSDVENENKVGNFCLQLKSDFFNAEKVVKSQDGFNILFYDTKAINYKINENLLIRKQYQNLDSLPIKNINLTTVNNKINQENFIQKITCIIYLFDETIEFNVSKKYPNILSKLPKNGD